VIAVYPYQVISPNGGEHWIPGRYATVRWLGSDVADVSLSIDGGLTWSTVMNGVGGLADNSVSVLAPGASSGSAVVRVSYNGQPVSHATSDHSDGFFTIDEPAAAPASRVERTFAGGAASDGLGGSVSGLADLNGDGYPELIIGASGAGGGTGVVDVYFGPGRAAIPDVVLTGEAGSSFGAVVAPAGDVNGDGTADLIVGATGFSSHTGRAYVFYGGPAFVSKSAASADVILTGEATNNNFGAAMSTAGDVKGDRVSDLIVGAPGNNSGTGRAYVFFGGSSLVSKPAANADVILTGEATGNSFGAAVSGGGDMNGDGLADVLVGAPAAASNAGRAYVFAGGASLVTRNASGADMVLTGEGTGSGFGASVATAGDVNGDGLVDAIVGAPSHNSSRGRAYLFYGGPMFFTRSAALADVVLTGEGSNNSFGASVASAGDANGDGPSDILVGASGYASGIGRVYIFYGGSSLASRSGTGADVILTGESAGGSFGAAVAGAGDLELDGFADLLVGAPAMSGSRGRAYVFDMNRYQILSPIGGETWNVGSIQSVSWLGAQPADLWISVDGGATYDLLDHAVGGGTRNALAERVPHLPTKFARIRITPSSPDVAGSARSDSLFTIQTSVSLLGFTAQHQPGAGTSLDWSTDPGVGPQGIAGYRLYRAGEGNGATGTRIGPDLITATHFTDDGAMSGGSYRLAAVNGLGEEIELGDVSLGPVRALTVWPLPYRGGDLHVAFSILGASGARRGDAEVGLYDVSGRLVKTLARGSFDGREQSVAWDGRDAAGSPVPAGIYFVRARSGGQTSHLKLTVVR
jgi:hypothetical protein